MSNEENWALKRERILLAKECYLFGEDTIYVLFEDSGFVYTYHHESRGWQIRKAENFWDSWDLAPHLFVLIDGQTAAKKIFQCEWE